MKLVIVGGVAGGASAATRARRLAEDAEIVLFERGPDVSFANCGLPYYIGGEIASRDKLLIVTPERFRERYRLDVRVKSAVVSIDREQKRVRVRELESGREYEETYDALILAPGAASIRPNLPGIDLPGIFTLRDLRDTDRIKASLDGNARRAVVIGAGFIGLETVENLVRRGIETSLVELQEQVLPPLDREMTTPIVETLVSQGVSLYLRDAAESFERKGEDLVVRLKSGRSLQAQLVVLGVGVRPESDLAANAGVELNARGGIRVNEFLQTSDPAIYAVGDAIEVSDYVLDVPTQVPLAGPANRQGRIAADNVFGRKSTYRGTQGTAIVKVFDRVAALTGSAEKTLQRAGRDYRAIYVHPANHAGYYPGAESMTLKLLFDPESGRVLGAQGVGGAGVDKRVDVISVAIQAGMTVFDLEQMELCYAPQFGSAKDPVNMAGFVAAGLLRGDHPQLQIDAFLRLAPEQRLWLLDVRTEQEFNSGHLQGATNIPIDVLREHLPDIPRDRPIAAYCQVGMRGYLATRILLQHGYDVVNLSGGYKTAQMVTAAWDEDYSSPG